ncbi:MAG TPA: acetate--CoA ligase family protein, partial [Acetobacteraceae bacterium]|nr:acetate--CoA ligase family protein [Acetobacteraceae bacterium]
MPDARFASLTPLFAPRSVAVLGASSDPTRISGRPIAYMKAQGFPGGLYPINPNRTEIQGLKAYPSVADLPETPDVAIVAVAAEIAEKSITELAERGVKAVVMFTAGFAEMDESGEAAQNRMVVAARKYGMRILGPNCLGVFDARTAYYATFSSSFDSGWPVPGHIGIASQSGAYGTHLYTLARNRGIGASLCIMTGNESDVTVGECIGWLAENPEVDVIAVYAEGIREAPGLIAAFEAARAAKKPIIMQKVGRSELGSKAAKSHTASIAGDDAVTEAVMAEFGVVRARNSEEMLDIAHTATRKIYPARNTLGVITVSGGAGVLISDTADAVGLPMPEMPAETQKTLRELVPFCAPRNPVDATAQVSNTVELIHTFTEALVKDGGYSSVLGFFSMTASSRRWPGIREQLNKVREAYPGRLYALSVIVPPDRRAELEDDGWVVHEDPTRAVTAIAAMGRFGAAFDAPAGAAAPSVPTVTLPDSTPSEAEAQRLLAAAGIASAPEQACSSADEAVAAAERFGFPVVMKILSPDILHK